MKHAAGTGGARISARVDGRTRTTLHQEDQARRPQNVERVELRLGGVEALLVRRDGCRKGAVEGGYLIGELRYGRSGHDDVDERGSKA